jgi:hypothetical protein
MDTNKNVNPWLSFDFQKNMLTAMPENVKVLYGGYSFGNEVKGYFPIYFFDFSLDKRTLLEMILSISKKIQVS